MGVFPTSIKGAAYALLLSEESGDRCLPVVIGEAECQSITNALKNVPTEQPMTHDLFVSFMLAAFSSLKSVLIYKFEEGIFYSKATFAISQSENLVTLDARTSDAVTLALKFSAPIYALPEVLDEAGVVFDEKIVMNKEAINPDESIELLTERLQAAVDAENYELASFLRDKINKKK